MSKAIPLRWMSLEFPDDKSILIHYLSQCWPISMSPYGYIRLQWINPSPPSAAYMRQWTGSALVQVMAVNWTLRNKLQWKFNHNTKFFIHKNASENIIYQMATILSRGKWVQYNFLMIKIIQNGQWYLVKFDGIFSANNEQDQKHFSLLIKRHTVYQCWLIFYRQ